MRLITFVIVFFISSPIFSVVNFPLSILIVIALLGTLLLNRFIVSQHYLHRFLIGYVLSIGILMVYYKSLHFIFFLAGFFCVYLLLASIHSFVILSYLKWISNILVFILAGAIFGVISHLFGIESFATFYNPNGDESLMYFFTLTNASAGNIIRPSGVFAEPGYLGFIVASVLFLRQIYSFKFGITSFLLFTTLITQSIAYILFFIFFIVGVSSNKSISTLEVLKRYLRVVFGILLGFFAFYLGLFDWVIERAQGFLNDELYNIRSIGWFEISRQLWDGGIVGLIFGFDIDCVYRSDNCLTYGGIPLVPLLFGGLLYSWPYYLFMFYLIFIAINYPRFRWISLGYLLITMSQPVFLELPYSLIYVFVLFALYNRFHNIGNTGKVEYRVREDKMVCREKSINS